MIKFISILFIPLIIILCIFGCGSNQSILPGPSPSPTVQPTSSVSGQALNSDGTTVIPYAYIVCYNLSGGNPCSIIADVNGYYLLVNLTPGSCRIEMWKSKADYDANPLNPLGAVNVVITQGSNTVNIISNSVDPTPTSTPTLTPTPVLNSTPTVTPIPALTSTPTVTPTPTITSTPTVTQTPTVTPTATPTATPTVGWNITIE